MPDIEEFYGQPNMNDNKLNTSKTELARASFTITQDGDCCGGHDIQTLKLSSDDGGAGWFWILETERWAFDSPEELYNQLREIINKSEEIKEKVEGNESIKTKK